MTSWENLLSLRWFLSVRLKDAVGEGEHLQHSKVLGSSMSRTSVGQCCLPETSLINVQVASSANWGGVWTSRGLVYPAVELASFLQSLTHFSCDISPFPSSFKLPFGPHLCNCISQLSGWSWPQGGPAVCVTCIRVGWKVQTEVQLSLWCQRKLNTLISSAAGSERAPMTLPLMETLFFLRGEMHETSAFSWPEKSKCDISVFLTDVCKDPTLVLQRGFLSKERGKKRGGRKVMELSSSLLGSEELEQAQTSYIQ